MNAICAKGWPNSPRDIDLREGQISHKVKLRTEKKQQRKFCTQYFDSVYLLPAPAINLICCEQIQRYNLFDFGQRRLLIRQEPGDKLGTAVNSHLLHNRVASLPFLFMPTSQHIWVSFSETFFALCLCLRQCFCSVFLVISCQCESRDMHRLNKVQHHTQFNNIKCEQNIL